MVTAGIIVAIVIICCTLPAHCVTSKTWTLPEDAIYAPGECDGNFTHPDVPQRYPPHYYARQPHARDITFPLCPPPSKRPTYDIVQDFGAVGDNKTINTNIFHKAIATIESAGGGTLIIPDGIYLTGPFNLTSCLTVTLVSTSSIIQAILDINLWPMSSIEGSYRYTDFISGYSVTEVTIQGNGRIDGGGFNWWSLVRNKKIKHRRPNFITFFSSQYITLLSFTVTNSPCYNIYPIQSQHIYAEYLNIINPADSVNTDGFDPDSCTNVTVVNTQVHTGDDAMAVKTHAEPSEHIYLSNWTVTAAHCSMVIGSHAYAGATNITVTNSHWNNTVNGFCFKGSRGTGGLVTNYSANNIIIGNVLKSCISLNDYYPGIDPTSPIVPFLDHVNITNLSCENAETGPAGLFVGLLNGTYTNIYLKNINIKNFKSSWDCQYVNGTYLNVYPPMDDCDGMKPIKEDE